MPFVTEAGDRYLEPAREAVAELVEKRSRFIGAVRLAQNPAEAKDALREVSALYGDATHHCWAYRVGISPAPEEYYSDAGEPSGTAGKPILGAIQRTGMTNTLVVVTRYYGGIKLGVRGLIEAYGGTARLALEAAGLASRLAARGATLVLPYEAQGTVRFFLKELEVEAEGIQCQYGEKVLMEVPVPLSMEAGARALFDSLVARGQLLEWKWN